MAQTAVSSLRACEELTRMLLLGALLALAWQTTLAADTSNSECKFPHHKSHPDLSFIQPLIGKRFEVQDTEGKYTYNIGVCTPAIADEHGNLTSAGIVQTEVTNENPPKTIRRNIGKISESEIRIGTDWAMLEYRNGDPYHTHCLKANRVAIIMVTCDPDVTSIENVNPTLITEENTKSAECYYLFELSHSSICNYKAKESSRLSIGSILCIVFVTLCGLYILGGVLYNRFILGAKGLEQIPNYSFWMDFGNLLADGCNLVCRTGRRTQSPSYKGVGDDQLGEAEDDRDDHLLPM